MKTSKKKKIIIGLLVALAVIAITLVLLNEWGNREHEKMLEAIKLEQELEAQELREQQEQEEKERQERLAKLEEGWNALGEKQQYLTLGSQYLKRTIEDNYHIFTYNIDFIDSLYMINDGWFQGVSKEDLGSILAVALVDLTDNATGRQVYDALCNYCENNNRSEVVTGQGADVLEGLVKNDSSPTSNNQTSNNNHNSSNKNNNSSNNNSQQQNSNNSTANNSTNNKSDEEAADDFAEQWGGTGGPSEYIPPVDPSGCEVGSAGWHAYWDGNTVKECEEQGCIASFLAITEKGDWISYPDNYVIGSYGIISKNYYGEGQHLYGKY